MPGPADGRAGRRAALDAVAARDALAAIDAHDDRMTAAIDARLREAAGRAGARWGCRAGRVDCCLGPFPINALDARRLRRGLAELAASDPARAAAVRARAAAAVETFAADYPGDAATGRLAEAEPPDGSTPSTEEVEALEAAQQAWFDRHGDLPCPALDPATGRCELYARRPFTCRTYGPPLAIGDEELPACPFCFAPCTPEETAALRVDPDPEGLEDAILDQLEALEGAKGETVIAWALAPVSRPAAPGTPDR